LKHFDGARRVVSWLRQHPQAQIYKERVERLAAIVEMERVAVAWRISRADLAGENLVAAVRQSPDFWREPTTYLRLFERSLTLSESAQWKRAHDPVWFEATVLGMLHLAGQELSMSELRQLRASVYLASSDLAYSMGNDVQRIRAVRLALQNSLFICLSKRGSTSVMRGFLGPKIPSGLSNLRARTGLEH
jgi:hypothetical protein